ncbi:unnamed protein product [Clavelina lepadiformis]|uniref:Uncharacterized protein n=1 Tax=Clavelina lepadiformis TaxID=159417 RepID=A0ABP0GVW5_CLALP
MVESGSDKCTDLHIEPVVVVRCHDNLICQIVSSSMKRFNVTVGRERERTEANRAQTLLVEEGGDEGDQALLKKKANLLTFRLKENNLVEKNGVIFLAKVSKGNWLPSADNLDRRYEVIKTATTHLPYVATRNVILKKKTLTARG